MEGDGVCQAVSGYGGDFLCLKCVHTYAMIESSASALIVIVLVLGCGEERLARHRTGRVGGAGRLAGDDRPQDVPVGDGLRGRESTAVVRNAVCVRGGHPLLVYPRIFPRACSEAPSTSSPGAHERAQSSTILPVPSHGIAPHRTARLLHHSHARIPV
jgi:hypothetical protein